MASWSAFIAGAMSDSHVIGFGCFVSEGEGVDDVVFVAVFVTVAVAVGRDVSDCPVHPVNTRRPQTATGII